ncbi:MAG: class I SAM-dependent methyltransferase [Pirellulales bacterium]|nr:class I SAM-dependent methyltransferase [Pirellulales bacterium]
MSTYRWNTPEAIASYDDAAEYIHPYYLELQNQILDALATRLDAPSLVVDAGGGSGRLMERLLERFPQASGIVLDQSEPYLKYARKRLQRFEGRAGVAVCRLQDDWTEHLPGPVDAIISMSAIHHLDPQEKQSLYANCYEYLAPAGLLLNGDEIRPESDETYLGELRRWDRHMVHHLSTGEIPEHFRTMVDKWRQRNIEQFGMPKQSGDDCHETIATHERYLHKAGFTTIETPWQRRMWVLHFAKK